MAKSKIGVLGTGDVGRVLAKGFAAVGHEVKIGSREAGEGKVTFADAAAFGDVIVIATGWSGTENALELAGAKSFAGKVVMDVTNPLKQTDKGPTLALGHTDSGGEQVQRWLPDARVVKVFNTVGNAHMINPDFPNGPPDMFICGNDADAKQTVTEICKSFGWPGTIDVGGIEGARLLEPMCILWVQVGIRSGSWNHAFKLLRK
jgi:8-hydroxy-5-deazaflavin:NADPH oxidoreductase